LGAHVIADAGHDVAKLMEIIVGQGIKQQASDDLDVAGQDASEEGAAMVGDGYQGGALVVGVRSTRDEAGFFQQPSLVGEAAAAVDNAVCQLRHGQLALGIGEAGKELKLHVADVALGPKLQCDLVLEQANSLHEHEVSPQFLGIECLDAIGAGSVCAGDGMV
jgi:hypothetical protein